MPSAPQPLRKYQFSQRRGNRFELLIDGEQFFPAMLRSIEGARRYVLLEMYLLESGQVAGAFIQACSDAAGRGVTVYWLLDGYGSKALTAADRARLVDAGVHVVTYNPVEYRRMSRNLFRDHRKLLLVDGDIAYTGGAGLIDQFHHNGQREHSWHDVMVSVQGPCVGDWQQLFFDNLRRWQRHLEPPALVAPSEAGTQTGRVVSSRTPLRSEIIRSFVRHIRYADRRVWLMTAYFVPSRKLLRVLRQGAHRGVDVRLILPGPHTDHAWVRYIGRRYYARLLRNGVRIFEYQPRFVHAKVLLCDDWCTLGSSNVDRWNFRWNLEANQEISDASFAAEVAALFESDMPQCVEYTYDQWLRRPWQRRLWEWLVGYIVIVLAWFSDRWRDPRHDTAP